MLCCENFHLGQVQRNATYKPSLAYGTHLDSFYVAGLTLTADLKL